eukprot:CAMPEP_0171959204 /NCGR_PEP_ID=MMETSP0993-20121228/146125_1 /TAXON_ID=483369 /ORGANISM="non described non described, Strain CCMP2098" /LENGTH=70 /DNA_ID=CAMNT_0012606661 /DNA_START=1 /DNA_END=210 /DNA_ORIENTATION=+
MSDQQASSDDASNASQVQAQVQAVHGDAANAAAEALQSLNRQLQQSGSGGGGTVGESSSGGESGPAAATG